MTSDDKLVFRIMMITAIMFVLLLSHDYRVKKLEAEQPKYMIELNNEMYELKKVEL